MGKAAKFKTDPAQLLRASSGFELAAVDTAATPGFKGGKAEGKALLEDGKGKFSQLQEKLFADSRFGGRSSVLLVLQAMDTAGKGGIVRHVVGAADPQGIHHHAFKAPTQEEKRHNFLWRVKKELPQPGIIGVFDRSHYEDVLIQRVHGLASPEEIESRYGAIRKFEERVAESGTHIIKVMLHISAGEQKERLRERLERPDKYWKYNPGDVDERKQWKAYQEAYQLAIEHTDSDSAPWYVVPADRKWYARIAVQQLLIGALKDIDPQWPKPTFDVEAEKVRLRNS